MKLLIPLLATLISFSLNAQETPVPIEKSSPQKIPTVQQKPAAKAPPATNRATTTTRKSTTSGRRHVVLPPSSRASKTTGRPATSSATKRKVAVAATPKPSGIQENITIQLKGSTGTGEALDLSLTGVGPIFQADLVIGKEATILSHTYSVTPQDSKYLVEFSIGMRIRMLTGTNGQNSNYEFRDNMTTGKVLLEPMKPVTIVNNQSRVMTLTVLETP